MESKVIAQAVKDYLVNLAVEDRLPIDINNLSVLDLQVVIDKTLPTERKLIIDRASHYLSGCSDDDEIAEMIDLINKHEDSLDLIDNVEGVIVWQKVEYSFTCEQFLEEIMFNDGFYDK